MANKTQATLDDLLVQMKISNRLAAANLKKMMQQNELITLLASIGASSQEIADVIGTSAAVVQVTIHRSKSKSAKKGGSHGKGSED